MKRLISFLTFVLLLAFPAVGYADFLGLADFNVTASKPSVSSIYGDILGDYDGTVSNPVSPFDYSIAGVEIFCVEDTNMSLSTQQYAFWSLDGSLLGEVAWIADQFSTVPLVGVADDIKIPYQIAIWAYVGVINPATLSGQAQTLYNSAAFYPTYSTSNWYLAQHPVPNGSGDYQDFLTPVTPIPEPGTMLLFGSGLIGLAVLGRKKFFR